MTHLFSVPENPDTFPLAYVVPSEHKLTCPTIVAHITHITMGEKILLRLQWLECTNQFVIYSYILQFSVLFQISCGTRRALWMQIVSSPVILTRSVNLGGIDSLCDVRINDQPKESIILGSIVTKHFVNYT